MHALIPTREKQLVFYQDLISSLHQDISYERFQTEILPFITSIHKNINFYDTRTSKYLFYFGEAIKDESANNKNIIYTLVCLLLESDFENIKYDLKYSSRFSTNKMIDNQYIVSIILLVYAVLLAQLTTDQSTLIFSLCLLILSGVASSLTSRNEASSYRSKISKKIQVAKEPADNIYDKNQNWQGNYKKCIKPF